MRKRALLVFFICAVATSASLLVIKGCRYFPESTFKLASDSRLPKWIVLPPGLKRDGVELSMSYYSVPWGPNVGFILQDTSNHVIQQTYGKECLPRFSFDPPDSHYPAYILVAVSGTIEVIEHKKMGPIFYVTDNASVLKHYNTNGCD